MLLDEHGVAKVRYTGDMAEIWGGYGEDMGEMCSFCVAKVCDFGLQPDHAALQPDPPPRPATKVCDFGLSRVKKETAVITARMGSPQWSAPEILRGISPLHLPRISPASSQWSAPEILRGQPRDESNPITLYPYPYP